MSEPSERENFDYFDEHRPEPKLELLDGRLMVGNGLAGSRLLLDHILRGWGVESTVAFGSSEQWTQALCEAYRLPRPTTPTQDRTLESLEEKAPHIDFSIGDLTSGEEGEEAGHYRVRSHLYYSLYEVSEALGGSTLGRDFVMRLGKNGFTPDAMFFKNKKLNTLYDCYLEGPAELIIEVTRPAHRHYDLDIKREHYARSGVPEYIIADPEKKQAEFLRLVRGDYIRQAPASDGFYRPQSVPGLAIAPQYLWAEEEDQGFSLRGSNNPFIIDPPQLPARHRRGIRNQLGWGELPFEPRFDLHPVELRFEEYICWSPEAKFEFWDGRIQICGVEGVRNLVGMLLTTLGMVEVCKFASPAQWIAALKRRRGREACERQLRDGWRQKARQAANELRAKYQLKRMAVTGDLLSPAALNYWSRLELIVWDVPQQHMLRIYEDLSRMEIDLIEGDREYFAKKLDRGEIAFDEI